MLTDYWRTEAQVYMCYHWLRKLPSTSTFPTVATSTASAYRETSLGGIDLDGESSRLLLLLTCSTCHCVSSRHLARGIHLKSFTELDLLHWTMIYCTSMGGKEGGGRREEGGREGGSEWGREGGREWGREGGREWVREGGREGGREGEREGGKEVRRGHLLSLCFFVHKEDLAQLAGD